MLCILPYTYLPYFLCNCFTEIPLHLASFPIHNLLTSLPRLVSTCMPIHFSLHLPSHLPLFSPSYLSTNLLSPHTLQTTRGRRHHHSVWFSKSNKARELRNISKLDAAGVKEAVPKRPRQSTLNNPFSLPSLFISRLGWYSCLSLAAPE